MRRHLPLKILSLALILTLSGQSVARAEGGLLEKLRERREARKEGSASAGDMSQRSERKERGSKRGGKVDPATLPAGTKIIKDLAYGTDALQKMDVYAPAAAKDAPIIIMVHGGGWKRGDKGGEHMVTEKVKYWQPKGFIYVSINYRLHPAVDLPTEANDVATALALVQKKAASWGGNPDQIIMMGHSAGAHLVSYLSANPALAEKAGAKPWSGTVSLDSAMLNAVEQMTDKPYKILSTKIYDEVLGTDQDYWKLVSPYHQLTSDSIPIYIVCSSKRKDACPQGYAFAKKAESLGGSASVLEQNLSHGEILGNLGKPGSYTDSVDQVITGMLEGR